MTELVYNYIAVNVICVLALIILAYESCRNVLFLTEMKKQFTLAALIAMTVILAEVGSVVFENNNLIGKVPALIVNTIGFSLSPAIAIVLSKAFSVENGKIRLFLTIPIWINLILAISSPWTGLIFNVNADISYLRGPLFSVYVVAYLSAHAVLTIVSARAMKHYQCQKKSTFIMLLIFTIVGTTVQLILPHVHVSWLCVTLSLILFYAYFCVLTQTQDTLTGLLSRNVYDQYNKNLRKNNAGMVIVFDLDNFKQINDLHGHQWGDYCLQTIGSLIKDCFYKMGYCYRIGGDEFCVISSTTDENQADSALKLFHRKVDETRKINALQGELPIVSTGYAIFYGSKEEYEAAVKRADTQMYSFKNSRKQKPDTFQKH